jgi:hypothetical protein
MCGVSANTGVNHIHPSIAQCAGNRFGATIIGQVESWFGNQYTNGSITPFATSRALAKR